MLGSPGKEGHAKKVAVWLVLAFLLGMLCAWLDWMDRSYILCRRDVHCGLFLDNCKLGIALVRRHCGNVCRVNIMDGTNCCNDRNLAQVESNCFVAIAPRVVMWEIGFVRKCFVSKKPKKIFEISSPRVSVAENDLAHALDGGLPNPL